MKRSYLVALMVPFAYGCTSTDYPTAAPTKITHTLSGTVYGSTAAGFQPIEGAQVGLYAWNEGGLDPQALVASTGTNSQGRYALSVEGPQQGWWVGALKPDNGYYESAQRVIIRGDLVLDFVLTPRP